LQVLDHILLLSREYAENQVRIEILYSTLYVMFIAEENKDRTRLGKRVKFLGIYQILKDGLCPETAANFSKGRSWKDISKMCEERGF
jgi:hypothetical protein